MKIIRMMSLCAAALLLGTTQSVAAMVDGPEVDWKVSVWGKKRAFTAGMEYVAAQLAERTGGKFKVTVHYGNKLSKARENLDGIQLGAFASAFFCNFYHPGKNPAWMVLTMPFLPLDTPDIALSVRKKMMEHPAFVADMAKWNAMSYLTTTLPIYQFMGRGDPPKNLSDWKGLRVRAGGGIGKAMKKLGAVPTTVPATEVYTSMERGTLDAISLPWTYAFKSYQVDDISSWYTGNISPGTTECAVVLNRDAFKALPTQYQNLLMELREPAYKAQLKAYSDIDVVNLPIFKSKLKPVIYSDSQIAEFKSKAGAPVWNDWIKENSGKFDAKGVLDAVLAAAADAKKMMMAK